MHTEKNRELLAPGVMLKIMGPRSRKSVPQLLAFPQTIQTPLCFPEVFVKVGPTASGSDLPLLNFTLLSKIPSLLKHPHPSPGASIRYVENAKYNNRQNRLKNSQLYNI